MKRLRVCGSESGSRVKLDLQLSEELILKLDTEFAVYPGVWPPGVMKPSDRVELPSAKADEEDAMEDTDPQYNEQEGGGEGGGEGKGETEMDDALVPKDEEVKKVEEAPGDHQANKAHANTHPFLSLM